MKWSRTVVDYGGNSVKIYVNKDQSYAVVFPPFGRYFRVSAEKSALDIAVSLVFLSPYKEITYLQYIGSQEDTDIIFQDAA